MLYFPKQMFMRFLSIIAFLFFSLSSIAQKEIKLEDVKDHVGDSVKVRGKVFAVKYLENAKNSPTLINMGAAYPDQLLTVVIWGDVRTQLGYKPEEELPKGIAVVYGKIELYKGKPQIVIKTPDQLMLLRDEEVPADQIPPIDKKKDN